MQKSPQNKACTRYYSDLQEKKVCSLINGTQEPNSGAGKFLKGDVIQRDASLLVECKTATKEKDSFSIKKEWITKNKDEARSMRLYNSVVAFNFGPESKENYFVIDEKLMKFLVDKLIEEESSF